MAGEAERVLYNAFEQALTGDVNRQQMLISKAVQEVVKGIFANNSLVPLASGPRSMWLSPPNLPSASGVFDMTVPAGRAMYTSTAVTPPDESTQRFVAWANTVVTHAAPDPANPRVDIIVVDATSPQLDTDPLVRNVLVNPTTRIIQGKLINKTRSDQYPVQVVTGTPAPVPIAPANPSGKLVLCEIYVPAAAANSSFFAPCQRLFRSSMGNPPGVGFGGNVICDEGTNETYLRFPEFHQFSIRGELLDVQVNSKFIAIPDTANNPFAVAAPGNSDVPYYIYIVGGFGRPSISVNGSQAMPYILVESLTPPNVVTGRPTVAVNTPRGASSQAALYIGMGFVRRGTTVRKAVTRIGEWVRADASADKDFETQTISYPVNLTPIPITLTSAPSISRETKMVFRGFTLGVAGEVAINATNAFDGDIILGVDPATAPGAATMFPFLLPAAAPHFTTLRAAGAAVSFGSIYSIRAYRDAVLRFDSASGVRV